MKIVHFKDYGGPEALQLAEAPDPEVEDGAIRIRIRAAAVNPADTKWRAGMFRGMADIPLPHVVGYDIAGEIDAVGSNVGTFKVGDRVVAKLDPVTKGGYAEYAVLPATDAVQIPAELDFATAAAIPTAALTGTQMVEIYAQPAEDEVVLVTGAVGAVGRFAVLAACKRGAKVIGAVRESQIDEARALNVDKAIILGETAWQGPAFDFILDTVGGAAVGQLCRQLAEGGRIFTAATTPIDAPGLATDPVFVMIQNDPRTLANLVKTVAANEIAVPIGKRLPLAQATEAHRLVEAGGTGGKVILEP